MKMLRGPVVARRNKNKEMGSRVLAEQRQKGEKGNLCVTSEGRKNIILNFFAFSAKFHPRPVDLGLGYRVPN